MVTGQYFRGAALTGTRGNYILTWGIFGLQQVVHSDGILCRGRYVWDSTSRLLN